MIRILLDECLPVKLKFRFPVEHKKLQMAKPCSCNELSVCMQHGLL